jgi:hypothetical protein
MINVSINVCSQVHSEMLANLISVCIISYVRIKNNYCYLSTIVKSIKENNIIIIC